MSGGLFGRVFGSCLRGWWQGTGTNINKYVNYAPNRKWRYNDKNLMNELTKDQIHTWDVMDLADDEEMNGKIASSSKLQLHDNVFVNPLDEEENNNTEQSVPETVQEISDKAHTKTNLVAGHSKIQEDVIEDAEETIQTESDHEPEETTSNDETNLVEEDSGNDELNN